MKKLLLVFIFLLSSLFVISQVKEYKNGKTLNAKLKTIK